MNIEYHTDHYINYAKFLQNLFWENNIECYLIGGSLINAVRDNGVFKSDDIDFAIIANENYKNLNSILDLMSANCPAFSRYNVLFSGKNKLNRSKLPCSSSTSSLAKSVL